MGLKGSVRADVVRMDGDGKRVSAVYDYKFGNAQMSAQQTRNYQSAIPSSNPNGAPVNITVVKPGV